MAVEHYSLAISWRYPSYWTILINWIFISAKLINCYDKWFEGRTCRPPNTLLLNIFFFQPERLLSFISVICLWNKTQDSLNAADDVLVCSLTEYCTTPRYFRGKYSLRTNLTMPVRRWGKEHLQVLDGGDPSESLTRNSLNLILAQVPAEKEMRKRKREILGFVWSHFTFRVLRKMDGSLERRASALKSETKLFYWP